MPIELLSKTLCNTKKCYTSIIRWKARKNVKRCEWFRQMQVVLLWFQVLLLHWLRDHRLWTSNMHIFETWIWLKGSYKSENTGNNDFEIPSDGTILGAGTVDTCRSDNLMGRYFAGSGTEYHTRWRWGGRWRRQNLWFCWDWWRRWMCWLDRWVFWSNSFRLFISLLFCRETVKIFTVRVMSLGIWPPGVGTTRPRRTSGSSSTSDVSDGGCSGTLPGGFSWKKGGGAKGGRAIESG